MQVIPQSIYKKLSKKMHKKICTTENIFNGKTEKNQKN